MSTPAQSQAPGTQAVRMFGGRIQGAPVTLWTRIMMLQSFLSTLQAEHCIWS